MACEVANIHTPIALSFNPRKIHPIWSHLRRAGGGGGVRHPPKLLRRNILAKFFYFYFIISMLKMKYQKNTKIFKTICMPPDSFRVTGLESPPPDHEVKTILFYTCIIRLLYFIHV